MTGAALALSGVGAAVSEARSADGARPDVSSTCSGTLEHPGVLSGVHEGNVTVEGVCAVSSGPATVKGELTVLPGGGLNAAYTGEPSLTVTGNVVVGKEATALLGCEATGLECLDNVSGTGGVRIDGNLKAKAATGVVVHDSFIGGSVKQSGGGGGLTCENPGPGLFQVVALPVYSDYEDGSIGGSLKVSGIKTCFLGLFRMDIAGNVSFTKDLLAEGEEINVDHNTIDLNLNCAKSTTFFLNSNVVDGKAKGQCVNYEG